MCGRDISVYSVSFFVNTLSLSVYNTGSSGLYKTFVYCFSSSTKIGFLSIVDRMNSTSGIFSLVMERERPLDILIRPVDRK